MPPAIVALRKPSSVSATQMTLSVCVASEPPEVDATSDGVGVVPSARPELPPRMICSSCSISDSSKRLRRDRAQIVEALAGIDRLEIDIRLEADALIDGDVILRRHRDDAAAIARRDAGAHRRGVDAGDGAPIRLDAALAGDARDVVAQRRQHREEQLRARLEIVEIEARDRRARLLERALRQKLREKRIADQAISAPA